MSGGLAPEIGAGEVYDPHYHRTDYEWDFGDAANAMPSIALNIPNRWKDTNRAKGKRVIDVDRDPGTYTVTRYAYEPASRRFGSQTVQVTIGDPAVVFSGIKTVIYDPDVYYADAAAVTAAGYDGATLSRTWSGALSARTALGSSSYGRILMAPGSNKTYVKGEASISMGAVNWRNFRLEFSEPNNPTRPTISFTGRTGIQFRPILFS